MRIGFVVNRLRHLRSSYTTVHLAAAAARMGLQPLFLDSDGLTLDPGDRILARAHAVRGTDWNHRSLTQAARRGQLPQGLVDLEQLDAVLLRNNPIRRAVLDFGRALQRRGVLVLNDPAGIAAGSTKLYLEQLPDGLKPRTLVTGDRAVLQRFADDVAGPLVLKPVRGFGGKGVTLVEPGDAGGLDGALRAAKRGSEGYVVAQEVVSGAEQGDKRILLLDGDPMGCYVRMRRDGEFRHNVHVGGQPRPARMDDADRAICSALAGPLRRDGIFLAGLDVIGGRAVEVNVVAPGGVANVERTSGQPVARPIVEGLAQRIGQHQRRASGNDAREPGSPGAEATRRDEPTRSGGPEG